MDAWLDGSYLGNYDYQTAQIFLAGWTDGSRPWWSNALELGVAKVRLRSIDWSFAGGREYREVLTLLYLQEGGYTRNGLPQLTYRRVGFILVPTIRWASVDDLARSAGRESFGPMSLRFEDGLDPAVDEDEFYRQVDNLQFSMEYAARKLMARDALVDGSGAAESWKLFMSYAIGAVSTANDNDFKNQLSSSRSTYYFGWKKWAYQNGVLSSGRSTGGF